MARSTSFPPQTTTIMARLPQAMCMLTIIILAIVALAITFKSYTASIIPQPQPRQYPLIQYSPGKCTCYNYAFKEKTCSSNIFIVVSISMPCRSKGCHGNSFRKNRKEEREQTEAKFGLFRFNRIKVPKVVRKRRRRNEI